MIGTITETFEIPDLRKRVLYTLGALAVYRIGASIPPMRSPPLILRSIPLTSERQGVEIRSKDG